MILSTGANTPTATRERKVRQGPGSPARQVQRGDQEAREGQGGAQVAHLPNVARYAHPTPARSLPFGPGRTRRVLTSGCCYRSPRFRRLWWYNIRSAVAHLLRQPMISYNHLRDPSTTKKRRCAGGLVEHLVVRLQHRVAQVQRVNAGDDAADTGSLNFLKGGKKAAPLLRGRCIGENTQQDSQYISVPHQAACTIPIRREGGRGH